MGKERVDHQENLAQIYVPGQTRTSTFISLLSDWERRVSGDILARKIYLAGSVKRNQAQPPAQGVGRVPGGWVSGLYVMRVKRSVSKAAFRQNIIAIYNRLRSKGASRKTAVRYAVTAAKSIRRAAKRK